MKKYAVKILSLMLVITLLVPLPSAVLSVSATGKTVDGFELYIGSNWLAPPVGGEAVSELAVPLSALETGFFAIMSYGIGWAVRTQDGTGREFYDIYSASASYREFPSDISEYYFAVTVTPKYEDGTIDAENITSFRVNGYAPISSKKSEYQDRVYLELIYPSYAITDAITREIPVAYGFDFNIGSNWISAPVSGSEVWVAYNSLSKLGNRGIAVDGARCCWLRYAPEYPYYVDVCGIGDSFDLVGEYFFGLAIDVREGYAFDEKDLGQYRINGVPASGLVHYSDVVSGETDILVFPASAVTSASDMPLPTVSGFDLTVTQDMISCPVSGREVAVDTALLSSLSTENYSVNAESCGWAVNRSGEKLHYGIIGQYETFPAETDAENGDYFFALYLNTANDSRFELTDITNYRVNGVSPVKYESELAGTMVVFYYPRDTVSRGPIISKLTVIDRLDFEFDFKNLSFPKKGETVKGSRSAIKELAGDYPIETVPEYTGYYLVGDYEPYCPIGSEYGDGLDYGDKFTVCIKVDEGYVFRPSSTGNITNATLNGVNAYGYSLHDGYIELGFFIRDYEDVLSAIELSPPTEFSEAPDPDLAAEGPDKTLLWFGVIATAVIAVASVAVILLIQKKNK